MPQKTYLVKKTEEYYLLVKANSKDEAQEEALDIEWSHWEFSDTAITVEELLCSHSIGEINGRKKTNRQ
jgi:hypothetical protein